MATITLTIPDDQLQRVVNAVCGRYGYDPNSGLTQNQFAKGCLAEWVKSTVRNWEYDQSVSTFKTTYTDPTVA